jgi:hypothetical protein
VCCVDGVGDYYNDHATESGRKDEDGYDYACAHCHYQRVKRWEE